MHRSSNGKKIALTSRDLAIFRTLARYRYLRSTYLHAFAGGASETRFKERLGNLFHEGYLDRPVEQWKFANSLYRPVVYELGKNMRQALSVQGIGEGEQRTWFRDTPHRQFEHSLMVCEILASIELGLRERPGLRFVPWPEILAKAPERARKSDNPLRLMARGSTGAGDVMVVPDAVFGIEYQETDRKLYRFFALEADRGTMPIGRSNAHQTSFLGKIAAYRAILAQQVHKEHLGIPRFVVLAVTSSEARKSEIVRRMAEQGSDNRAFLFKSAEETTDPTLKLFSETWEGVDLPPLAICSC